MRYSVMIWSLLAVAAYGGWLQLDNGILQSAVTAPGELSEYRLDGISAAGFSLCWCVSSEEGYDFFEIEADGAILLRASGSGGWRFFSSAFSGGGDGGHSLILRYRKDASGSGGSDCARVYGLAFGDWGGEGVDGVWRYRIAGGRAVLTAWRGSGDRARIPGTAGGLPVAGIDERVFPQAVNLLSLEFADGIMFLGDGVFQGQDRITRLEFPPSLHFIGKDCFRGCGSLESISSGASFLYLSEGAFMNCSSLRTTAFLRGPEEIPPRAFWGCSSLSELMLPEGVLSVGAFAFAGSGLIRLGLPASCAFLEDRALLNCSALQEIAVSGESAFFRSEGGILLDRSGRRLVFYPPARQSGRWRLPDSVQEIAPYAFYGAGCLQNLDLGGNITELPGHCLQNCVSLQQILLPEGLRVIGREALAGCSSLASLALPASLEEISEMAFWGCAGLAELDFDGVCPRLPEDSGSARLRYRGWRGVGWEELSAAGVGNIILKGDVPPVFHPGGGEILFGDRQLMESRHEDRNLEIFYSLDGSSPSPAAECRYRGAFAVDRSCVLRCRGFREGQPQTAEQTIELTEIGNLPLESEEEFLIGDCGDGACSIEEYLGRRRAFRIPERLYGLICRGISAGLTGSGKKLRVVECPATVLWLEMDGLSGLPAMILEDRQTEIIGDCSPDRLFFRKEFTGLAWLRPGWNLYGFRQDLGRLQNCGLWKMQPLVLRGNIFCRPGEKICSGEGVWLWSRREGILPYVSDTVSAKKTASGKRSEDWQLKYWTEDCPPDKLWLWQPEAGWRPAVWNRFSRSVLGWGRNTGGLRRDNKKGHSDPD